MSKLYSLTGSDDFCPGGSIYPNPKDTSLFLSLGRHVDVYFPPRKRSRVSAPFVFGGESVEEKKASIEVLPDECLFEILRRLDGGEERGACASVSKRWLTLLSNIHRDELCSNKVDDGPMQSEEAMESEGDGFLSRSLEGKKATDVRLAAISVGTASRGGLGKLVIRGSNATRGVSDVGLKAISCGCPSLKVLSLWNVPAVGDDGVSAIASGCHSLEKLDLCSCPMISDKALVAIAKNCPKLTDLTLESCPNIGDEALRAIGKQCPNLKSISVKDCPLIGDQGIAGLLTSASLALTKLKLQALGVTDVSLAVIGQYGLALTDLVLANLPNVTERGFWVLGIGQGLQKLRSLTVTSCLGVTDLALESVAKGCPNLKQFCLQRSAFLSDNGLVTFANSAGSMESLQLEECHRITQIGLFGVLVNCGAKLKTLAMINCLGIKEYGMDSTNVSPCKSLRSLTIRNCPGVGNSSLVMLGKLCPQLQNVELSGLQGITDAGLLPLVENCEAGLVKVNLSGCINLTDKVVSAMVKLHGWTMEVLVLDGCRKISDSSLATIADNCVMLSDLDVSKCAVSDLGLAALAKGNLSLQVLSVSGCSAISDKSLPALVKLGQTLGGLNLQYCNGVSSRKIGLLVEKLWRCDILS